MEGIWYDLENKSDFLYFHQKSDNKMDMIWIDPQGDKSTEVSEFEIFTSNINSNDFLNLKLLMSKNFNNREYSKNYFIGKYEIKSDTLHIFYLKNESIKNAIENGLLSRKGEGNSIVVTDKPEQVVKYIKNSIAQNIFENFGEFKKIEIKE